MALNEKKHNFTACPVKKHVHQHFASSGFHFLSLSCCSSVFFFLLPFPPVSSHRIAELPEAIARNQIAGEQASGWHEAEREEVEVITATGWNRRRRE